MEAEDLAGAAALLSWDQATYMPAGGAPARARQLAVLERLAHEKRTNPRIGQLLDALEPHTAGLPYDSDEASLVRVARRDFERAIKVPPAFTAEYHAHVATAYDAWVKARLADDFRAVAPHLARMIDLSRQYAGYFPGYAHVADPLIEEADEGMTVATLRALFSELRGRLVPLVQAISDRPLADNACLRQHFPEKEQWAFGEEVVRRFGYDFGRGRQDKTAHPFTIKFSLGDVRITTRFRENDPGDGLFSTMHESGHAMYEQGIRPELEATLLAHGTSAGLHESQSRLWENLVGRSLSFWHYAYPRLQAVFPQQLGGVSLETFYRAINRVERSLIRTDADEVTYNLHIMIRFDLELALLEGQLAVQDLPEAWRERYRADLGIAPPDDRDGVLQDVHWWSGYVGGAFQGYALGNIMSAQLMAAARRAHPGLDAHLEQGEFAELHGWLRANIYQHGRKFPPAEVIQRATGEPLSVEPYLRYLWAKYQPLYGLSAADLRAGQPAGA